MSLYNIAILRVLLLIRRILHKPLLKTGLISAGVVCIFLLSWQAFVHMTKLPPYFLPSPWQVAQSLMINRTLLMNMALPTLLESLLGLLLAIVLGVLLAVMLHLCKVLRCLFMPLLVITQALPMLAIAPLVILWLGYDFQAKVMITLLALFFPVVSASLDGLSRSDSLWQDLALTMNARKLPILFYLSLPRALPQIASGIRVAAAWAPMSAIVGEWIGGSQGLGFLMQNALSRLDVPLMFAALIILVIWALILYQFCDWVLKKLVFWH